VLIKHLKNNDINLIRWDNCINNAINGSVFAYSWYLNILCEDWEALVLGNYEYVMPLFHKQKFNYDIYFTSTLGIRLGVFSNKILSEEIVGKFMDTVPKNDSLIDISFNIYNQVNITNTKQKNTYQLDLIQSHQKITKKYSDSFKENLAIARENKISVVRGLLPNELINFSLNTKVSTRPKLRRQDIPKLRMIIASCLRYNLGETYCAYGQHNNLQALAFFIKSKKNLHLLYAAASKDALETKAFHLIIDKYIELHSEKDLTLNLENSIAKSYQDFVEGVGASQLMYQRYYSNNLPLYLKLLLKHY